MRAIWIGVVIAETDDTVVMEGNHCFPLAAVRAAYLTPSDTATFCSWKGTANHCSLSVNGKSNRDAVWYYAQPKDGAQQIRGRVALWQGVRVTE
jgi:uncharacterized protein (DUF427 family)